MWPEVEADDRATRYLLGELSPEERDQFEDRYFADAALHEQLQAIEEELIDSYVRNELSSEQRMHFEQRFLLSPQRREKCDFAKALAKLQAATSVSAHESIASVPQLRSELFASPSELREPEDPPRHSNFPEPARSAPPTKSPAFHFGFLSRPSLFRRLSFVLALGVPAVLAVVIGLAIWPRFVHLRPTIYPEVAAPTAQQQPASQARELLYTAPPEAAPKPASHAAALVPAQAAGPAKTAYGKGNVPAPTAQEQPQERLSVLGRPALQARDLFYTAAPEVAQAAATAKAADQKVASEKTAAPSPIPLGIRYAVLKGDAEGEYVEVDSSAIFHSGDRIRLQINANASGYLYVVHQGSSGAPWELLFPSPKVAGGSNYIQKGESRIVPPGGQWRFDQQPGTEKLFLVLARRPQPDLDKLIHETPAPQNDAAPQRIIPAPAIGDNVVSQLRQVTARDLIFEKVDSPGPDGKVENAAYVVNPSSGADARVVVDVALKHN